MGEERIERLQRAAERLKGLKLLKVAHLLRNEGASVEAEEAEKEAKNEAEQAAKEKAKQESMLKLMSCVNGMGLDFAYPTQTIHVENMPGEQKALTGQRPR